MSEQTNPIPADDSLDSVERVMAIEKMLNQIYAGPRLSFAQRELLIREVEERIESGEFGDEGGGALAALVRKRGPRDPSGQAGAAAEPEEPSFG
jgi:hypothetical protein